MEQINHSVIACIQGQHGLHLSGIGAAWAEISVKNDHLIKDTATVPSNKRHGKKKAPDIPVPFWD